MTSAQKSSCNSRTVNSCNEINLILDSIDGAVYADMVSYEILYANRYMRNLLGGIEGTLCWQSILKQSGPCSVPQAHLLTPEGKPAGVHVWQPPDPAYGGAGY